MIKLTAIINSGGFIVHLFITPDASAEEWEKYFLLSQPFDICKVRANKFGEKNAL